VRVLRQLHDDVADYEGAVRLSSRMSDVVKAARKKCGRKGKAYPHCSHADSWRRIGEPKISSAKLVPLLSVNFLRGFFEFRERFAEQEFLVPILVPEASS
jgi:hypothetical protein